MLATPRLLLAFWLRRQSIHRRYFDRLLERLLTPIIRVQEVLSAHHSIRHLVDNWRQSRDHWLSADVLDWCSFWRHRCDMLQGWFFNFKSILHLIFQNKRGACSGRGSALWILGCVVAPRRERVVRAVWGVSRLDFGFLSVDFRKLWIFH